jgi:hypothetical protein
MGEEEEDENDDEDNIDIDDVDDDDDENIEDAEAMNSDVEKAVDPIVQVHTLSHTTTNLISNRRR